MIGGAIVSPAHSLGVEHDDFTMRVEKKPRAKILAIDGGGVRGLIPAIVLKEIEKRTGRATAEIFDLVAGTSTGAIIAGGLTLPSETDPHQPRYSAQKIVDLFYKDAKVIFKKDCLNPFPDLTQLYEQKYSREGMNAVFDSYFGQTLLKDALTEVIIPSYNCSPKPQPWFFERSLCQNHEILSGIKVSDAIKGSTAAPTFFPPYPLDIDDKQYVFLDGGLFLNNPAHRATVTADHFYKPQEKIICSLGTGQHITPIPYSSPNYWGALEWNTKLIYIPIDANSQAVDQVMHALYPERDDQQVYYRYQTEIAASHSALDDASQENLTYLADQADRMIVEHDEEFEKMCRKLARENDNERLKLSEEFY